MNALRGPVQSVSYVWTCSVIFVCSEDFEDDLRPDFIVYFKPEVIYVNK